MAIISSLFLDVKFATPSPDSLIPEEQYFCPKGIDNSNPSETIDHYGVCDSSAGSKCRTIAEKAGLDKTQNNIIQVNAAIKSAITVASSNEPLISSLLDLARQKNKKVFILEKIDRDSAKPVYRSVIRDISDSSSLNLQQDERVVWQNADSHILKTKNMARIPSVPLAVLPDQSLTRTVEAAIVLAGAQIIDEFKKQVSSSSDGKKEYNVTRESTTVLGLDGTICTFNQRAIAKVTASLTIQYSQSGARANIVVRVKLSDGALLLQNKKTIVDIRNTQSVQNDIKSKVASTVTQLCKDISATETSGVTGTTKTIYANATCETIRLEKTEVNFEVVPSLKLGDSIPQRVFSDVVTQLQ